MSGRPFFPFDEMPSVSICFVKAANPPALSLKLRLPVFHSLFVAHIITVTVFPIVKISVLRKLFFSFVIFFFFSFSVYYAFIRRFLGTGSHQWASTKAGHFFNLDDIQASDAKRMQVSNPLSGCASSHRILSAISSCSTYWRLFGAARPDSWRPFRSAAGRGCPASAPRDSRRTRTRQPDIPPPPCTILGTRTTTDSSRCNR